MCLLICFEDVFFFNDVGKEATICNLYSLL